MKKGQILLSGNDPMRLDENTEAALSEPDSEQRKQVEQVGATIKSYLNAAEELLSGKYHHIKDWAPAHLAQPGNVLAVSCPEGVVIRYERRQDRRRIFAAWMPDGLPEVVALLSQNMIHCYRDRNFVSTIPTSGTELTLFTQDPVTGHQEDIAAARIGFDAVIERPPEFPPPPQKPFCLLSVRNAVEVRILGEMQQDNMDSGAQRFLARNIIRFQAGWECIEVFPFFELDRWKPEFALMWAENDLLATIVTRQFQESRLQSLDPNAAARKHFARVLNSFKALLDSDPDREETIQVFLRENPVLLSPTYTRLWPKVPLGACVTDFIFQEAAGDYTLVEIERSTYHLFIQDGDTSRHLNHARNQVQDWKRYLEDNLSTVQRELGLAEISANPKSLIIIGRSNQMSPENRRKLVTIENESPKVKILTYDDVYANAKAVMENLLGPIWDTVGDTQIFYLPANHPGMPG